MAPPVVCRCIQDSEPIEIGEALGAQWFHIGPVLLTARANRKCRHFLCRKPLPLMGGNEPHWPRSGCEPRLKRPDFWLADPVGRRGAYGIGQPEVGTLEARFTSAPGPVRFIPTHQGQGLPTEEMAALPIRSGSKKNGSYMALGAQSFTDFDWFAVLDTTTYNGWGHF